MKATSALIGKSLAKTAFFILLLWHGNFFYQRQTFGPSLTHSENDFAIAKLKNTIHFVF